MCGLLDVGGGLAVLLLLADLDTVVLLVPLTVWGGIDLDDAALHEGVGTQQLVIGGVVHNVKHTSALGDGYTDKHSIGELTPVAGRGSRAQTIVQFDSAQSVRRNRLVRFCSKLTNRM